MPPGAWARRLACCLLPRAACDDAKNVDVEAESSPASSSEEGSEPALPCGAGRGGQAAAAGGCKGQEQQPSGGAKGQQQLVTVDAANASAVRAGARRERLAGGPAGVRASEELDPRSMPASVATPLAHLLKRFSIEEVVEQDARAHMAPQAPGVVGFLDLAASLSGLAWMGQGANGR